MRRILPFLLGVLSFAAIAQAEEKAEKKAAKDADLGKKEASIAPDKSLAGDVTRKKKKEEIAPSLNYDEFRLGVQAFGDLGTSRNLLPRAEHFIGPVAKYEIEGLGPEVGLEVGYLFAVAKAKDDADGQLRVALEMEF